jgi:hypothetical protein
MVAAEAAATLSGQSPAADSAAEAAKAIQPEPADEPRPPPGQTLRVNVVDRDSGQPVTGIGVHILPDTGSDPLHRTPTDANGIALLHTGGRPMTGHIGVSCRSGAALFPFPSRRLAAPTPYTLHDGVAELTMRIDPSRCEPISPRQRKLRLRGMYVPAFESSDFYPCDGLPPEAGEYEYGPHSAWVELGGGSVGRLDAIQILDAIVGDGAIYVDWSGTLTGPGSYGHFGMGLYRMQVDDIHDTGMRKPGDCDAPGFDERMRTASR